MDQVAETISFTVNGRAVGMQDGNQPLLWYLRDRLGLKGAKFGCGHGGCGVCTVQIDGHAEASCTVAVKDVAGKRIITIEGVAAQPGNPVIRAWLAEQVPQCGYCQPGMIVAVDALLAAKLQPTDSDIDLALQHVLCRCGTYQRARRAIHRAAERRWDDALFPSCLEAHDLESPESPITFNPWVKICRNGTVVVVVPRSEMGQGVTTALPMLVAEELGIPMARIQTEFAPADQVYDDPIIHRQITVGSLSVQNNWLPMRRAGADACERLITAAAQQWNVERGECHAADGAVIHEPSGRSLDYGSLAVMAAALPAVVEPTLKRRQDFHLLGTPTARLDIPSHVTGRTIFGIDVTVPGMLVATVLMPPVFAARIRHIDATRARAVPGVRDIVEISNGIAVVADDHSSVFAGRDALIVEWTGGESGLSSDTIIAGFRASADCDGNLEQNHGNVQNAFENAGGMIEADYETPYLAHAAMEPMNCTARIAGNRCEVWVPTQGQSMAREAAATAAGLPADAVDVHTTFLGGGFGRRSVPDVVFQAVQITRKIGRPIQLLWPRDEDMRHDRYRPASLVRLKGSLDTGGNPTGWLLRVVGPELANEGVNVPYDIANLRTEYVENDPGVPFGYWRSVGSSQNAFAIESFIDELAHAAHADPVDFRLKLLAKSPRHRNVLALATEKSGWRTPAPKGRARGVAVYYAHGGWAAEVSVSADRRITVSSVPSIAALSSTPTPSSPRSRVRLLSDSPPP